MLQLRFQLSSRQAESHPAGGRGGERRGDGRVVDHGGAAQSQPVAGRAGGVGVRLLCGPQEPEHDRRQHKLSW